MANEKISQLPSVTNASVGTSSLVPVVDSTDTVTKSILLSQLDLRWGSLTQQQANSAAITANQPMTTVLDMIVGGVSGAPSRLAAGTARQFISQGAYRALVPLDTNFGFASKTASYGLTTADYGISFSGLSGTGTGTLPTAVGIAGQRFILFNNDSTNNVAIATTSSQTVGGRVSSNIVLSPALGDYIEVMSDGANYQIVSKKETKWLTASTTPTLTTPTTFRYSAGSPTITLTPGAWRIGGFVTGEPTAAGASALVAGNYNVWAADGANTNTAPTGLTAAGASVFGTSGSGSAQNAFSASVGSYLSLTMTPALVVVTSNLAVYGVTQCTCTAGNLALFPVINAERVW